MSDWIIYGLHSGDGVVRYVGYTTQPRSRLLQHMSAARCGKARAVSRWIASLVAQGRSVEMVTLEAGTGDDWEAREIAWIKRLDGRLLNQTSGGRTGPAVSPEARSAAGQKLKGRIFSAEHRRRISEAKIGTKRPDNLERNRANGPMLVGRKMNLTDEERERRRARGRTLGSNVSAYRQSLSDEEKARRSALASSQMKAVWAKRRADKDRDSRKAD